MIYALISLVKVRFSVATDRQSWIGGIVGLVTGVIAAATGVQVIPAMPFMQAIGMEKDELVQALGRVLHHRHGGAGLQPRPTPGCSTTRPRCPASSAMVAAFAGMFVGQAVRTRLEPEAFRRWFLIAMLLLGLYLAGSALATVHLAD